MPPSIPPFPTSPGHRTSPNPQANGLEFDLWQRYDAATQVLERMLVNVPGTVAVLELGPNYLNPLPLFLNPDRLRLTRADVNPVSTDSDFVLLPADGTLPFANESFDAVIGLEVLEHMPAERRRDFLKECLRVARHGVIVSCPNGVPEVEAAEARANEAYRARHGSDHPWLAEHREFGVPREADVVAILRELDYPHAVLDNAPLHVWLPMLLLCENLSEQQAPADLHRRLNDYCRAHPYANGIPYRKIYVIAKSFDATGALEAAAPISAPAAGEELFWLASATSATLAGLELDRRNDRVADAAGRKLLETEIDEVRRGVALFEARLRERDAEIARLDEDLAVRAEELRTASYRHHVARAYAQTLRRSPLGRLTAGLTRASRFLRSVGVDKDELLPWANLERDERAGANAWSVTGPRACFIAPCALPAGWVRVNLRLDADQVGWASIAFDSGEPGENAVVLERVPVHGRADRKGFVYLPRPVLGVRLAPLDVTGRFKLESFEVTALSWTAALRHALRRKVEVLRNHGLLRRSLGNGLGLLVRGRWGEAWRKLHGGLTYRHAAPQHLTQAVANDIAEQPRRNLAFAPAGIPVALGSKRLAIVYVLRSAGLCGGVKVVLEHAARLYARGHDVSVYYLEGDPSWFSWRVPTRRFPSAAALQQTLRDFRGIKVATWYETAPWVADSLKRGDRGYYLVQDIEESYGDTPEQTAAALRTYSLGLKPITEGTWVRQQLKHRFGLDSVFVSIGLDHARFGPQLVLREPQRILTQSRTWSGGVAAGARLKGWDAARDTILRCHAANPRTTLTTFSIEEAQTFPPDLSHIHHQKPSDEKLAELYGQAGIYLLTSRHEGFGLTAAEAMACGCPVVATQAQGNEEFCIDGVTALTAPVDDAEALARHCLRLQTDPALARHLGKAGQDFIRQYTWERAIDRLEREFLERDGPEVVIDAPAVIAAPQPAPAPAMAPPSLASVGACRRGGEYPDLRLRGSTFVDWSIVIPTIGKAELVSECVASCRRFIPAGVSVQFIVVDDGSSDATVIQGLRAAAREHDFLLLFNHQNLGFSASVNRGLRRARGRYAVLCNNDIVFHRPWLEPLEQLFTNDPHVGIIGAKLLYPDNTIQHAGMDKARGSLNWFHTHGKQPGDTPEACQTRYAWAVTGALFAVRRSVLDRLGGLSTAYATAYEDLDYCLYAWANGVRVAYSAEVCAYHLEGHTRGATEAQKRNRPFWAEREVAGRAYFEKKWAFLKHVEDFRALMSLMERGAEFPIFASEPEKVGVS